MLQTQPKSQTTQVKIVNRVQHFLDKKLMYKHWAVSTLLSFIDKTKEISIIWQNSNALTSFQTANLFEEWFYFWKGISNTRTTQMLLSHSMSTSDDKNIIFNLFAELLYLNHFANDCVMHFDFISSAPQWII